VRWIRANGDTVTPIEEVRIGQLDGPKQYAFGAVIAIDVDRRGRFYVYDSRAEPAQRLHEYDSAGTWIRDIGRDGSGPGEYSQFVDVKVLANDDILIADQDNARFTRFNADGKIVGTWPQLTGNGRDMTMPTPDGGWFAEATLQKISNQDGWIHTWIRYGADGRAMDTLVPPPEYVALARYTFANDGKSHPRAMDAISPNGVRLTARNDQFDLVLRRGAQVDTVKRNVELVRYSDLERKGLLPQYRMAMRRSGQNPNDASVPEFKDTYRWINYLPSGQIMAQLVPAGVPYDDKERGAQAVGFRTPVAFDLLTEAGAPIGRLLGATPSLMRGDTIWGMVRGTSGEQYVVRWRLPAGR
jgi:hypothetical protein